MNLVYPGSEEVVIDTATPPGSKPLARPAPIVRADRLEYLVWDVADLPGQRGFLEDFGMTVLQESADTLYMRGHGPQHYLYVGRKAARHAFVGAGFCVNSREELDTLAAATGEAVTQLDRPGGGSVVTLTGPNGILIEVCWGIEPLDPQPTRKEPLPVNTPGNLTRVNSAQRPPLEPSALLKLGHLVTGVNRIEEAAEWYMRHLGLLATDVQCVRDGSPAIVFMRLDRGDKPADHHTLVVGKGAGEGYLHSAYEVIDLDAIAQGQQYLKSRKRDHLWGIGRHILGSQLFDYWKDPEGFEFEHYADGDVFTAEYPTAYHPLDSGNVYAWGPDMPKSMMSPGVKQVLGILRAVIRGDISLAWLRSAMKSISRPARPWL